MKLSFESVSNRHRYGRVVVTGLVIVAGAAHAFTRTPARLEGLSEATYAAVNSGIWSMGLLVVALMTYDELVVMIDGANNE